MKICAAQTKPVSGHIQENINNHKRMLEYALSYGIDAIFSPELSLTGYEPRLAEKLAMKSKDSRLEIFQKLSDIHGLTIGAGLPLKQKNGADVWNKHGELLDQLDAVNEGFLIFDTNSQQVHKQIL